MPLSPSSLQKALYLKKVFNDSFNQTTIESLGAFNQEFDELIEQLQAVETGQLTTLNYASLKYNRGNPNKERFTFYSESRNDSNAYSQIQINVILEDQVSRLCKTFVENLEDKGIPNSLRQSLHQKGIYSILYANSRTSADAMYYLLYGPKELKDIQIKLALSAVSVAFFAIISFLGPIILMPLATAFFAASVAYISGLLYGVMHCILSTRFSLPYYLLGHMRHQRSFFLSNNPLIQGIGWGLIATNSLAQIAAIAFGVTVFITACLSSTPIATFVLPLLMLSIPLVVLTIDLYTRYRANKYIQGGIPLNWVHGKWSDEINSWPKMRQLTADLRSKMKAVCDVAQELNSIPVDKINFDAPELQKFLEEIDFLDEYQLNGLSLMCSSTKDKARWFATLDRNLLGYIIPPLISIGALIALLSISNTTVPVLLFSTLCATTIPIVVAAVVTLVLAIALRYTMANRYKQIDNKYKLQISSEDSKKPDELYFNEDQAQEAIALVLQL